MPRDASRPLGFVHIPKTAGSSLLFAMAEALGEPSVVRGFDRSMFGSFTAFDTVDPTLAMHIHESPSTLPAGSRFIAGHFSLLTVRAAYPSAQVITVLREPCSRLLSQWVYWRQQTDSEMKPWGAWADYMREARQPLASFLCSPHLACQTDNLALRMLLWPHHLVPADRFIDPANDEDLLAVASDRLSTFDFLDVVENDCLVSNLQRWSGRPVILDVLNETGLVPAPFRTALHREFTTEAQQLLRSRTRLDLHLWHIAATHYLSREAALILRERVLLTSAARYASLLGGV